MFCPQCKSNNHELTESSNSISTLNGKVEAGLISMKVLIPNENNGSISCTFIPIINKHQYFGISGTRVRDMVAVISYKQKIANPHEFSLYLLSFATNNGRMERLQNGDETWDATNPATNRNSDDDFYGKMILNFYRAKDSYLTSI